MNLLGGGIVLGQDNQINVKGFLQCRFGMELQCGNYINDYKTYG